MLSHKRIKILEKNKSNISPNDNLRCEKHAENCCHDLSSLLNSKIYYEQEMTFIRLSAPSSQPSHYGRNSLVGRTSSRTFSKREFLKVKNDDNYRRHQKIITWGREEEGLQSRGEQFFT